MGIFDKKNTIKIEQDDLRDAKLSTTGFDSDIKKRAFLNVLSARVAMKMLFEQDIAVDNVYSLYTIQNILKKFDISDVYYGSTKLDVRMVFNREEIFVPKSHYENSIIPDLYLFFEVSSDVTSAEFLGFISPDKINKTNCNDAYYFVEMSELSSPNELNGAVVSVSEKSRENIPESEMKIAQDMFMSLTDNAISDKDLKHLLNSLAGSYNLRKNLVEFENFELISTKSAAEDAGVEKDAVLGIIGAQDVCEDEEMTQAEEKAEIMDSVLTDLIETEELKADQNNSVNIAGAAIEGAVEGLAAGAMAAGVIGAAETLASGTIGAVAGDALGAVASGAVEGLANSLSNITSKEDEDFLNELADNSTLSGRNNQNDDQNDDPNESDDENDLESLAIEPDEMELEIESEPEIELDVEPEPEMVLETELEDITLDDLVSNDELEDLSEKEEVEDINIDNNVEESQELFEELVAEEPATLDEIGLDEETFDAPLNLLGNEVLEQDTDTDTLDISELQLDSLEQIDAELENAEEQFGAISDNVEELEVGTLETLVPEEVPEITSLDDVGFVEELTETPLENLDAVSTNEQELETLDNVGLADEIEDAETSELVNEIEKLPLDENESELSFTEAKTSEANSLFADADVPFEGLPELSLNYAEDIPDYMKGMVSEENSAPQDDSQEISSLSQVEQEIAEDIADTELPMQDDINVEAPLDEIEEMPEEDIQVPEMPVMEDEEIIQSQEIPVSGEDENILDTQPEPAKEFDETASFISEIDDFLNSIDDGNISSEEVQDETLSIDDLDIDNISDIEESGLAAATEGITSEENATNEKDPLHVLYKKASDKFDGISTMLPAGQNVITKFKNKKTMITAAVIVVVAAGLCSMNNLGSNQQSVPAEDALLTQMQDENKQRREDDFNQTLPQDAIPQDGMMQQNQMSQGENVMAQNAQTHVSQSIEESMSNAFVQEPVNASVTKIAWEIPERYAYNNEFRQYLQIAGKNLKLNLQNELILSDNVAYSDRVIVNIRLSKDGSLQNSELVHSSGSKGIDKIVLQSVKTTLNYLKMPAGTINDGSVEATLIINF